MRIKIGVQSLGDDEREAEPALELSEVQVASALVVAMLKQSGGTVTLPLEQFVAAGHMVTSGARWGLFTEETADAHIVFHLHEPDAGAQPAS